MEIFKNIKDILDIGLLRLSKDANKMKEMEKYICSLPEEIKGGDKMIQMLSYIKSGDALMISESISDLPWLQQHIILALFKILNSTNDKEMIEQRMNKILPTLIEKKQDFFVSSDNEIK